MCKCTLSLTLLKVRELSPFRSLHSRQTNRFNVKKLAHQDFVNIRLGGIDTTGEQGLFDRDSSSGSSKVSYAVAAVVVVVTVVGTIGVFIIRNRK